MVHPFRMFRLQADFSPLWKALAVLMLVVLAAVSAHAQVVCSLGTAPVQVNPALDSRPSPRAIEELRRIAGALCPVYGCGSYKLVSNPTVPNASAAMIGPGLTKISYQPEFMNQIAWQYGGGATFGILAHEFGHHIDLHTTPPWMNTSWSRELKADAWAGCALARTGVGTTSLENSLRAIAAFPSPTHPHWPLRLNAVRRGFVSCGGWWPQGIEEQWPSGRSGYRTERDGYGNVVEGPYVDDEKHGRFTIRLANGGVQTGPYVNGMKHGNWTERDHYGNVRKGPYFNGEKHGRWSVRSVTGVVFPLCFVNGEKVACR